MHNIYLGVVASVVSEESGNKDFISLTEHTYNPIEIFLPNNHLTLDENISIVISKYTSMDPHFAHFATLVDLIKDNNSIWLYYAVALPSNIELKQCYKTSWNISIVHPILRKALKYV